MEGGSPLMLRDLPEPQPAAGEVLLRVLACGVCHTDVHLAEGDLPPRRPGVVPGHQIVGRVEAAGAGVTWPAPGETVGVTWLAGTCGACAFCRGGRENLCADAVFTGWDRDGGYAERVTARADFTVPLPEGLPPEEAAPLLCAGVIGHRALRLAEVQPGRTLGLVGFGASAHLVLQEALHRGLRVLVFTRGRHHREQARAMGAEWAGGLEDAAPDACDGQILFAPSGALVPECLRHLRRGGTLAVNAVHLSDLPAMPYRLLFGERTVRSVSHVTRADACGFLELAARAPIRAQVTRYPFAKADRALRDVKAARIAGQAVLEAPAAGR
jgi:propanol-preferring alcohol dehydrogenase